MSSSYVGEIRIFAGNFAPAGWSFCEGQLLPIAGNEPLFALIGTTYGGDGQSTFALPDLRGRIPLHFGNGYPQGQTGGVEAVTLAADQMPAHTHQLMGSTNNASNGGDPSNAVLGQPTTLDLYRPATMPNSALGAGAITSTGGSQPHSNLQPYLCVSFIISLFGVYPPQP